jgi:hypothetical protein
MSDERNIFEDDKKLINLCEDYLHHVAEMNKLAEKDPEQTAVPSKLIAILRYGNDPIPLTESEFKQIQDFVGDPKITGRSDYADWKLAYLQQSAASFLDESGAPKNIAFDSMIDE